MAVAAVLFAASTALVVAHRPSTVALADRVAVLERGEITAIGTHHDQKGRVGRAREAVHVVAMSDADGAAGKARAGARGEGAPGGM